MKKNFLKIVVASLSFLLVFATVGPVYADAHAESKGNTLIKSQTNLGAVSENQIDNIDAQPYGIKTQLVKTALKSGGSALGKLIKKIPFNWAKKAGSSIEKWGYKAANVIDEITDFGETSVTITLVAAGIPPGDAVYIAQFIVFFLG